MNLIQSQHNLYKSSDDRILDLLSKEIKLSVFKPMLGYIKHYITNLSYTPNHYHLLLREITEDHLYVFCFIHGYQNFNKGLYHLIEQTFNKLTIKNQRQEYEEVIY